MAKSNALPAYQQHEPQGSKAGSARGMIKNPRKQIVDGCLAPLLALVCGCGFSGMPWTEPVAISESTLRPRDLAAYPRDGQILARFPHRRHRYFSLVGTRPTRKIATGRSYRR